MTRHSIEPITLQLSDKTYGDTVVKQQATFKEFSYKESGVLNMVISVKTTSKDGSDFGNKVFATKEHYLIANHHSIVDASNQGNLAYVRDGDTITNVLNGETTDIAQQQGETTTPDEKWEAFGEALPNNYFFQDEFFRYLCDTQSVLITPMIIQHIQAADDLGKTQ